MKPDIPKGMSICISKEDEEFAKNNKSDIEKQRQK